MRQESQPETKIIDREKLLLIKQELLQIKNMVS
jgi:hypothetical protein